jgi:hypothetical protein
MSGQCQNPAWQFSGKTSIFETFFTRLRSFSTTPFISSLEERSSNAVRRVFRGASRV